MHISLADSISGSGSFTPEKVDDVEGIRELKKPLDAGASFLIDGGLGATYCASMMINVRIPLNTKSFLHTKYLKLRFKK